MATGFTHTVGRTYKTDAGTISSETSTYTANDQISVDENIAVSDDATFTNVTIDVSQLKSMMLYSDHDLTLETNSPTDDTIILKAKKMVMWNTDSLETCPLTVDTTQIKATNASATNIAHLTMSFLVDATV